MATERQYLRNTQTEPTAGGIVWDLSDVQGSPQADVGEALNDTAFTEVLAFVKQVGDTVNGTSFPVSINISSVEGTLDWRFRVQRRNSSGVVQDSSAYSATQTTAGTHTETLSLSTTWATGDLLTLSIEIRRTAGHGNVRLFVSTQDANSYVDADFVTPPEEHSGSATVSGGGLVSVAGAVAMAGTLALSGGGAITTQASVERSGAVTISAGGGVTASGEATSSDKEGTAAVTGGGTVAASGQPARAGPAAVSGGGSLTLAGQGAKAGAATLAGGGSVVLAGQPAKAGALTASGGGSVTASGSATGSASGSAVVSGGGAVTAAGAKSLATAVILSEGGEIVVVSAKSAIGSLALSGGGGITLAGAKYYTGPATVSGGGSVVASGTADAGVGGTASVSGGGQVVVSGSGPSQGPFRVPVLERFSWQERVLSIESNPPASPNKGDRYIVGATATGDWAGHEDSIAWWTGDEWQFDGPFNGWKVYNLGDSSTYRYDNGWAQDSATPPRYSIEVESGFLQLVGDVSGPGSSKVYGTDSFGDRVWRDAPEATIIDGGTF